MQLTSRSAAIDARGVPLPLHQASDAAMVGGKAAQLGQALRGGLAVPPGIVLPWPFVDQVATGDSVAIAVLKGAVSSLGPALVARSSAVGEDSDAASFAGQHLSVVNVAADQLVAAVQAIRASAHEEATAAYRRRVGQCDPPRVAVVVQNLISAEVAGVAFCPHPVTGANEVVIEASWGLGEAVVSGLVTPDLFRLDRPGEVLQRVVGLKDVRVRPAPGGGAVTNATPDDQIEALCLDDAQLLQIHHMVMACQDVFGGTQDTEWAFADGALWLLQRRPVTGLAQPNAN